MAPATNWYMNGKGLSCDILAKSEESTKEEERSLGGAEGRVINES